MQRQPNELIESIGIEECISIEEPIAKNPVGRPKKNKASPSDEPVMVRKSKILKNKCVLCISLNYFRNFCLLF